MANMSDKQLKRLQQMLSRGGRLQGVGELVQNRAKSDFGKDVGRGISQVGEYVSRIEKAPYTAAKQGIQYIKQFGDSLGKQYQGIQNGPYFEQEREYGQEATPGESKTENGPYFGKQSFGSYVDMLGDKVRDYMDPVDDTIRNITNKIKNGTQGVGSNVNGQPYSTSMAAVTSSAATTPIQASDEVAASAPIYSSAPPKAVVNDEAVASAPKYNSTATSASSSGEAGNANSPFSGNIPYTYSDSIAEQQDIVIDAYDSTVDYANKQKEKAYAEANDAYRLAMRDAQANYEQNNVRYGANAENLLSQGLEDSGYGEYLAGKREEQRSTERMAAASQMSAAKIAADSAYDSAIYAAEQNKLAGLQGVSQLRGQYAEKLEDEFKLMVNEVVSAVASGQYSAQLGQAVLERYNGGALGQDLLNALSLAQNEADKTVIATFIDAMYQQGAKPSRDSFAMYLDRYSNMSSEEKNRLLNAYFDADGNMIMSDGTTNSGSSSNGGSNSSGSNSSGGNSIVDIIGGAIAGAGGAAADTVDKIKDNLGFDDNKVEGPLNEALKNEGTGNILSKWTSEKSFSSFIYSFNRMGHIGSFGTLLEQMRELNAFDDDAEAAINNLVNGIVVSSAVFGDNNGWNKDFREGDLFTVKMGGQEYRVRSQGLAGSDVLAASAGIAIGAVFGYKSELYIKMGENLVYKIGPNGAGGNYNKLWKAVYGEALSTAKSGGNVTDVNRNSGVDVDYDNLNIFQKIGGYFQNLFKKDEPNEGKSEENKAPQTSTEIFGGLSDLFSNDTPVLSTTQKESVVVSSALYNQLGDKIDGNKLGDNFSINMGDKTYRVQHGGVVTDGTLLATLGASNANLGSVVLYNDQLYLRGEKAWYKLEARDLFGSGSYGKLMNAIIAEAYKDPDRTNFGSNGNIYNMGEYEMNLAGSESGGEGGTEVEIPENEAGRGYAYITKVGVFAGDGTGRITVNVNGSQYGLRIDGVASVSAAGTHNNEVFLQGDKLYANINGTVYNVNKRVGGGKTYDEVVAAIKENIADRGKYNDTAVNLYSNYSGETGTWHIGTDVDKLKVGSRPWVALGSGEYLVEVTAILGEDSEAYKAAQSAGIGSGGVFAHHEDIYIMGDGRCLKLGATDGGVAGTVAESHYDSFKEAAAGVVHGQGYRGDLPWDIVDEYSDFGYIDMEKTTSVHGNTKTEQFKTDNGIVYNPNAEDEFLVTYDGNKVGADELNGDRVEGVDKEAFDLLTKENAKDYLPDGIYTYKGRIYLRDTKDGKVRVYSLGAKGNEFFRAVYTSTQEQKENPFNNLGGGDNSGGGSNGSTGGSPEGMVPPVSVTPGLPGGGTVTPDVGGSGSTGNDATDEWTDKDEDIFGGNGVNDKTQYIVNADYGTPESTTDADSKTNGILTMKDGTQYKISAFANGVGGPNGLKTLLNKRDKAGYRIIFSNQVVKGPDGAYYVTYDSNKAVGLRYSVYRIGDKITSDAEPGQGEGSGGGSNSGGFGGGSQAEKKTFWEQLAEWWQGLWGKNGGSGDDNVDYSGYELDRGLATMQGNKDFKSGKNINIEVDGQSYTVEYGDQVEGKKLEALTNALGNTQIYNGEVFIWGDGMYLKKDNNYYSVDPTVLFNKQYGKLKDAIAGNDDALTNDDTEVLAKLTVHKADKTKFVVGKDIEFQDKLGKTYTLTVASSQGTDSAAYNAGQKNGVAVNTLFHYGQDYYVMREDGVLKMKAASGKSNGDYDLIGGLDNDNLNTELGKVKQSGGYIKNGKAVVFFGKGDAQTFDAQENNSDLVKELGKNVPVGYVFTIGNYTYFKESEDKYWSISTDPDVVSEYNSSTATNVNEKRAGISITGSDSFEANTYENLISNFYREQIIKPGEVLIITGEDNKKYGVVIKYKITSGEVVESKTFKGTDDLQVFMYMGEAYLKFNDAAYLLGSDVNGKGCDNLCDAMIALNKTSADVGSYSHNLG